MDFLDLSPAQNNLNFGISEFNELRPAEQFVPIRKIWDLKDGNGWVYHYHWRRSARPIQSVGLYKIKDLVATRPSGLFMNRKLGFGACESGYGSVDSIPYQDELFRGSHKNKIVIEEDVILGDGVCMEIYGHWIVDLLPRFGIVRDCLKENLSKTKVLLVTYGPTWVYDLLLEACNIKKENIVLYHPHYDIVLCKNAIVPSYSYTGPFLFHSYFKEFYRSLCPPVAPENKKRKILVSRSSSSQSNRKFPLREFFEQEAAKRGYEIILPENLSFPEQIKIFSEAKVVIGEHGSGMHNTVFSDKGTIVGCLGFWNAVQLHIGFMMEHQNVYLSKGCKWPTPEKDEYIIGCSEADIISFFGKIQLLLLDDLYSE